MKKIISLFLTVLLLCSCLMVTASAENSKISPQLQEVIEGVDPDEMIIIAVNLSYESKNVRDMPSWPDDAAARRELREYITSHNEAILDEISAVADYELIYASRYAPMVFMKTAAKDIDAVAQLSSVASIDYVPADSYKEGEPAPEPIEEYLLKDAFIEWLEDHIGDHNSGYHLDYQRLEAANLNFQERFYHYSEADGSRKLDWALIEADCFVRMPWGVVFANLFGKRVLLSGVGVSGSEDIPYWVYDAEKDDFRNITDVGPQDYDGLEKAFKELNIGRLLGDVDNDGSITVIDATRIQKALASIKPLEDDQSEGAYLFGDEHNQSYRSLRYSDFDLDGETTITDATHIQRYLASIE